MNTPCANHRVRMISSEVIYANKWDEKYGREPVKDVVVFKCLCCGESRTVEYPNISYKKSA